MLDCLLMTMVLASEDILLVVALYLSLILFVAERLVSAADCSLTGCTSLHASPRFRYRAKGTKLVLYDCI